MVHVFQGFYRRFQFEGLVVGKVLQASQFDGKLGIFQHALLKISIGQINGQRLVSVRTIDVSPSRLQALKDGSTPVA